MTDLTNHEAYKFLCTDMEMLRTGDWQPDDHSIDATIDMINVLYNYSKKEEVWLFIFELIARLLYGKDYQKHLEKPPRKRPQKRRRK